MRKFNRLTKSALLLFLALAATGCRHSYDRLDAASEFRNHGSNYSKKHQFNNISLKFDNSWNEIGTTVLVDTTVVINEVTSKLADSVKIITRDKIVPGVKNTLVKYSNKYGIKISDSETTSGNDFLVLSLEEIYLGRNNSVRNELYTDCKYTVRYKIKSSLMSNNDMVHQYTSWYPVLHACMSP
ncbi:MAG: hypothetical protein OEZ10_13475 [Gammaproteobacteria bacterium]|nr:hypothetical protein [Gammaproteobacteria bacterium]